MMFFIQILFNYIFQKHKMILSDKFNVMKLKYKGSKPEVQRVRGKKNAKINLVDSQETSKEEQEAEKKRAEAEAAFSNKMQTSQPQIQTPEWELKVIDQTGEPV